MTALNIITGTLALLALTQSAITHHKLTKQTPRKPHTDDPIQQWLDQIENEVPEWLAQIINDEPDDD